VGEGQWRDRGREWEDRIDASMDAWMSDRGRDGERRNGGMGG
jgi:hypothetical protein